MIQPVLTDDAFLTDVADAQRDADDLHIWWLGQSGYLVQWKQRHLLIDPYLSDSLTRKYAQTDKPHVRMTGRVVAPGRLDFIDVVSSSHNHTDHLDADTLGPLLAANPALQLVIPEANRQFVADRLGIEPSRPIGVDDGGRADVAGFALTGVPAAHEARDLDAEGRSQYLGYVIRCGPWTIYHSGDTIRYDGMVERLGPQSIDVALLPINGRRPERQVPGNLSGPEAATLAREIGARLVVPCHFEMFEFNTEPPDAFVKEAERIGQLYRVLRCGERWSSTELPSGPR